MTRPYSRRTKIVATLGPSWADPEQMTALLDAGVDLVRVNSSHSTPEIRYGWIGLLKKILATRPSPAGILVDLQGPRIRVGTLESPLHLEPEAKVVFVPEAEALPGEIPHTYAQLHRDLEAGSRILMDDGLLEVVVIAVDGHRVTGRVRYGGELRSNKGINLPDVDVSAPALTERDRREVARTVEAGVDYIALSFVRRPEEVEELRTMVPGWMKIIAKIEKDTALRHLNDIISVSDAIMVARGDLGVELPFEEVPLVQKRMIRAANLQGKIVITATQMLESMVHAPRPTRAEASDVANAILDGTDAVMLSAETAVGTYPEQAVLAMNRIAREVERNARGRSPAYEAAVGHSRRRGEVHAPTPKQQSVRAEDAIGLAVCVAADLMAAPLILCFTSSGFTARKVAAYRPGVPIVAVTHDSRTARQLRLVWGVLPILVERLPDYDSMLARARERIVELDLAESGQPIIVTAGVPFDTPGTTNVLKVEIV